MGRYVSIFLLGILIIVFLFFSLSLLLGEILGEYIIFGLILVILGSFIITLLFYIIDLVKKKSR
ncbi:hypothetical protein [Neobacillus sp. FSL H8-0543]|uniref:hypothetical protein n=1 Tax=Neobacillus sp. FSL H8-0543 TaxID=2954672 RepID=UPI003158AF75